MMSVRSATKRSESLIFHNTLRSALSLDRVGKLSRPTSGIRFSGAAEPDISHSCSWIGARGAILRTWVGTVVGQAVDRRSALLTHGPSAAVLTPAPRHCGYNAGGEQLREAMAETLAAARCRLSDVQATLH